MPKFNRVRHSKPKEFNGNTIIEYTDIKTPKNQYPARIISPTHSSNCCHYNMKPVGELKEELGHFRFRYSRCDVCGFAVRKIISPIIDLNLIKALKRTLLNRSGDPSYIYFCQTEI